jgi:hypothetical protein
MIAICCAMLIGLQAAGVGDFRPRVVVLPAHAEAKALGSDGAQFAQMLLSELSSAARGAEVLSLDDAVARAAVVDPGVLRCEELACAAAVGHAVEAQYVVATEIAAVGQERAITVRLQDVIKDRLVAMHSEKATHDEDVLGAVAARAALRMASAARLASAPDPAKPDPASLPTASSVTPQSAGVGPELAPAQQPQPPPTPAA